MGISPAIDSDLKEGREDIHFLIVLAHVLSALAYIKNS